MTQPHVQDYLATTHYRVAIGCLRPGQRILPRDPRRDPMPTSSIASSAIRAITSRRHRSDLARLLAAAMPTYYGVVISLAILAAPRLTRTVSTVIAATACCCRE